LTTRTPVFRQWLTDDVKSAAGREFWVCTKHTDVARVHRDDELFTVTRGPLIQDVPLFDARLRLPAEQPELSDATPRLAR
jgi:hypothetical protein